MRTEILGYLAGYKDRYFPMAYAMAQEAHVNDKRKDGSPYMSHVDAVIIGSYEDSYMELNSHSMDQILCIAALHDVVEDHPEEWSLSKVGKKFEEAGCNGSYYSNIITGIDAITKMPKGVERYSSYVHRVFNHNWARLVKIADLKHNMSDLPAGNMRDKYDLTLTILSKINRF